MSTTNPSDETSATPQRTPITMDIHQIMKKLPHRYPILLVDRVLDIELHKSIRAIKNITFNEPIFTGHFPRRPVFPGVLILEALAQTSALLSFTSMGEQLTDDMVVYFAGIDGARFKRPVEPGDQLILESTVDRVRAGIYKYSARATVDGMLAAEAELMCTMRRVG
ncbi:beta-hydroxyacyl-(acyl-carrier-protein) dehydratase FabZ [Sphaerotilus natans subsp. natans DSM 6575]|jgi:3-hydroxyacyl-[acyl-carrier-protein] dehydratase|uniref:3-hydroxyacyl-[acyl-carrier-protein] dehydratase FabZ n=2 Tax=Sphaerotilus natans TaxID=34103 RepID=A0A059KSB1_9BURK|nr:beta-hydroxyacyl-(acyl-carrier-protein) dehydratase FabZ [Sphaerotilus natans subsp. natans DSM 6575]SIS00448.1 3-hydroxyacyl-[acyl-carrier-protein] dehydratase [Sphaerotilus natans]